MIVLASYQLASQFQVWKYQSEGHLFPNNHHKMSKFNIQRIIASIKWKKTPLLFIMQRIKQLMFYVHPRLFTSYSFHFEHIYSIKKRKVLIAFHVTAAI